MKNESYIYAGDQKQGLTKYTRSFKMNDTDNALTKGKRIFDFLNLGASLEKHLVLGVIQIGGRNG